MRLFTLFIVLLVLTGCAASHKATSCSGSVFAINPVETAR